MKGRDIIKGVLRSYRIEPKDFFGYSRLPRLVRARQTAARQMHKAGISVPVISRLMQRDQRTIFYHIDPAKRAHDLARSARYYAAKREERRPYWTSEHRKNRVQDGAQQ